LGLCGLLSACHRNDSLPVSPERQAPQKPIPIIGAYYYPWYSKTRWTEQPATDTPKLGRYSSDDRNVAAQHISWARQADIDFLIVSWISPRNAEDLNLKRTLLPAIEKENYGFIVLYETPLALGLPAGGPLDLNKTLPNATKAGDTLVEHFEYLSASYLRHRNYFRFQGRPVVIVYAARDLVNAGPYFKLLRQRLAKRGIDPYLIADVVYWRAPEKLDWAFIMDHFQAVSTYNMYFHGSFLDSVRNQFRVSDQIARSNGVRLIPNVMPGYDDTHLRGSGRPTLERRAGEFYRDYWNLSSEFLCTQQPFLFITSFNEWHEGSEVEPSIEYGDAYLKATRELTAQLRMKLILGQPLVR
jgi:hypothetical protein